MKKEDVKAKQCILTAFLAGHSSEIALFQLVELILVKTCANLVGHARTKTAGTYCCQASIDKPIGIPSIHHQAPSKLTLRASTLPGVSVGNTKLGSSQLSPRTVWPGRFHTIS